MPGLSTATRNGWRERKKMAKTAERKIADDLKTAAEQVLGRELPPDYYDDPDDDCRGYINDEPRLATQMLGRLSRSPGSGGLDMDSVKRVSPPQGWRVRPLRRRRPASRARRSFGGRRRRTSMARDDGGETGSSDGPGDAPAVDRRLEVVGGAR